VEPSYSPALDQVTLPHLSQFEHADHYFATLAHEVVHASGARKRLNRFGQFEGDRFERYGFEEYVVPELCCAASSTMPLAGVRAIV
jgi:antirestriction protein ArdC